MGGLIGLTYFEYKNRGKYNLQTLVNVIYETIESSTFKAWTVLISGILVLCFNVFIISPKLFTMQLEWPNFLSALYNGFSRTFYVFGIGLILIPCFLQKSGLVGQILGGDTFTFLQRVTYTAYMTHLFYYFYYFMGRY